MGQGWGNAKDKLKMFIDDLNKTHHTLKLRAEWSNSTINFLDVAVSIKTGITETDLHIKPTDSHQQLLSSSSHPFYCKKGTTYSHSQELRLNHIFSVNDEFDKGVTDIFY